MKGFIALFLLSLTTAAMGQDTPIFRNLYSVDCKAELGRGTTFKITSKSVRNRAMDNLNMTLSVITKDRHKQTVQNFEVLKNAKATRHHEKTNEFFITAVTKDAKRDMLFLKISADYRTTDADGYNTASVALNNVPQDDLNLVCKAVLIN